MQTIKVEQDKGLAVITIDNGKVNAIDTMLAKELADVFIKMDQDDSVKGVILSGRPHCFSAGLDVAHLAKGGVDGAKTFWEEYLRMCQELVRFSKPFICAITGYAPAGATIIALCADYRIMGKGEKHRMGMHEFKMSMQIPELMCDIYAYHVGEKKAWEAVQNAQLFNSDDAIAFNMVNESVEVEEVLDLAKKRMKRLINVYAPVYKKSKRYLRKDLLKIVDRDIDEMVAVILKDLDDPFVKQSLEFFLASLQK